MGIDPVSGHQIGGLYTDAFRLVAEVIETKIKPEPVRLSFADPKLAALRLVPDNDPMTRSILAVGHQDTDIAGLTMPLGVNYLGATSDHLVVHADRSDIQVGSELKIQLNYNALACAMTAPDVAKVLLDDTMVPRSQADKGDDPRLAPV